MSIEVLPPKSDGSNEQGRKILPSPYEIADKIAELLGEHGDQQIRQIRHIVYTLGIVQAWALLMDAAEIEERGGMMVQDGSRRRTPGGTFFHLAYTRGVPEDGKKLRRFPPPFDWEDRGTVQEPV